MINIPQTLDPIVYIALKNMKQKIDIISIASCLSIFEQRKLVLFLEGMLDTNPDIPEESRVDKDAKFLFYNWLKDEVFYEFTFSTCRYFDTKEHADEYEKIGIENPQLYFNSSISQSKEYPYAGVYSCKKTNSTTLQSWLNLQV